MGFAKRAAAEPRQPSFACQILDSQGGKSSLGQPGWPDGWFLSDPRCCPTDSLANSHVDGLSLGKYVNSCFRVEARSRCFFLCNCVGVLNGRIAVRRAAACYDNAASQLLEDFF